jgi:hypothetical protein
VSRAPDLIEDYLVELRAGLRLPPARAGLILAEAEDHLRETVAGGRAAGMTELEAQQAAISAFGSVRAVVRAHASWPADLIKGRTPGDIAGDLVLAGWRLAGTGLAAVGVSGAIVLVMNSVLGRAFTGQAPAGVSFGRTDCAYWMSLWPGAPNCRTAQMLEASSDAVVLRLAAGITGLALLAAYGGARSLQRRRGRGPAVVLAGYFPLLAAGVFAAGAAGLVLDQLTGFGVTQGPGAYLSGAIVAAAVAAWYGRKARPAIRHLVRRRERRAGLR